MSEEQQPTAATASRGAKGRASSTEALGAKSRASSAEAPEGAQAGYKKTKLGWIPEEWEVNTVKSLGKIITGRTPSTGNPDYYGGDYPFAGPSDLGKKYVSNTLKSLTESGWRQVRPLPKGTILCTCIGSTIGKMSIASALMSTNQQINAVIVSGGHDPEYAYHALMQIAPNMRLLAGEQAVPMLNKKDFSALKIVLPPLPEQHRIAAILGTWDRAIATVQQLLAAQQKRKRGLMQELLSGIYHRVKKVDIGSVATEVTVRNVDNAEYPVLSCSKHVGFVSSLEYFKKQVYSDDRSNYKVIRKGQFGFPANHIEEGSIDLLRIHDIGVVSPIYVIFEFDGESVNSEFMRYLFKTERYRHIFSTSTNASVDRRGSLRWKDFQTIAVPLPHKQEQDRIANVFQRLDALIESQEALLTRLTAQKRGLMQQLLTGRVRVKHSIQ